MTLPRAVTVVGLGLIGGSLCKALRERVPGVRITGIDNDVDVAAAARRDGACDTAGTGEELLDGAELVVVCVPVNAIPEWLVACASRCPEALVTDCGSTKSWIVARARGLETLRFLGGHPMAGGERGGYAQSTARLFDGSTWVLTPVSGADLEPFGGWREALRAIGAHEELMTPAEHDRAAAWASHLPLALSSTLVHAAASSSEWGRAQTITAGSFRDLARPAGCDPRLLVDIATTNCDALLEAVDGLIVELEGLRAQLVSGGEDHLLAYFERSRAARAQWLERREREGRPVR